MTLITERAVALARAGYAVWPANVRLDERGKKVPSVPGSWLAARADAAAAGRVFGEGEYTGALINAEASGIVVVDLDLHDDVDGEAALAEAGIELPVTPMVVRTWSGGKHLFFRQPEGEPIGTHQGIPARGVDIRGLGGAVFAPFTEVWQEDSLQGTYEITGKATRARDLPRLPKAFADAIRAHQARQREGTGARLEPYTGTLSEHQERVISDWLAEDTAAIEQARPGERHRVLLSKGAKVMDRAVKLGYSFEQAIDLVRSAYERSGGTEWEEKRLIVEWHAKKLAEEPMGVPSDWTSSKEVEFEQAVAAEVAKLRIRDEARRRFAIGAEPLDMGRELDFDEPADGLHGRFWVDGVVPMGETVLLFGERNVGKSFVGSSVGLSVASGERWYGREVSQGNVLYLAGEGAVGLPARRRAWCAYHGVGNPERFRLRDRIVRLGNPESMAAWQKVIMEQEIDLVIVDTLRRASRGKEMENPGDAQEIIELLDDLRRVRHGCSVLALGHPTKTQPDQPAGAGVVQDALPMIHRLTRQGEGVEDAVIDLTTTKSKDGPTGRLLSFSMKPVGESLVFVEQTPYSLM